MTKKDVAWEPFAQLWRLDGTPTIRATDEITLDVIRHLLAHKVDHDIIIGVINVLTTERPARDVLTVPEKARI